MPVRVRSWSWSLRHMTNHLLALPSSSYSYLHVARKIPVLKPADMSRYSFGTSRSMTITIHRRLHLLISVDGERGCLLGHLRLHMYFLASLSCLRWEVEKIERQNCYWFPSESCCRWRSTKDNRWASLFSFHERAFITSQIAASL